jgi:hypothetical protein
MHAARWPILERRKIKGDGVVEIGVEGIESEPTPENDVGSVVLRESVMDGLRWWKRDRSRRRARGQEVHHKPCTAEFTEVVHNTGGKRSKATRVTVR